MRATIETAPQRYGRIDGDVDASNGKSSDSTTAFVRRMSRSRLREEEKAEYSEAYNEAYELECKLRIAHAETGSWTVLP
jgi:hypothetical protein